MSQQTDQPSDKGRRAFLARTGGAAAATVVAPGVLLHEVTSAAHSSADATDSTGRVVVLFSDGIVEQRSEDGAEFGLDRVFEGLDRGGEPAGDVDRVVRAVRSALDGTTGRVT